MQKLGQKEEKLETIKSARRRWSGPWTEAVRLSQVAGRAGKIQKVSQKHKKQTERGRERKGYSLVTVTASDLLLQISILLLFSFALGQSSKSRETELCRRGTEQGSMANTLRYNLHFIARADGAVKSLQSAQSTL